MSKYVKEMWRRAEEALKTAEVDIQVSPDACASRAYYAAFYAVSALFAREDREFTKHTAVRAAVHRDLVKAGRWPVSAGQDYSFLYQLRQTGDYGGAQHVSHAEAREALQAAERILRLARGALGGSTDETPTSQEEWEGEEGAPDND